MKKIITSLIILFFSYSLISQNQKADIIFNDGTILEGLGMIMKNDKIKFRLSQDDESDIWTDLMVKGIIFYGFEIRAEYEYVKLDHNQPPKLLELINRGKVNLYNLKMTNSWSTLSYGNNGLIQGKDYYNNSSSHFYVKRGNEDIATSLKGNFKRKAREYFIDCDVIIEMIDSGEFRKYSTEEIVEDYNIYCSD